MTVNWKQSSVLVTGGASFIGSHLIDYLTDTRDPSYVTAIDDLSSGKRRNLDLDRVRLLEFDLHDTARLRSTLEETRPDVIFHLAADHGGRGYVDTHQVDCGQNMALDMTLFHEAHRVGVPQIVYASSGCVYPNHLQTDPDQLLYLTEEHVGPPYDADNMYGWAKLMAEMQLRHYADETAMQTVSCRYFTVYGPRGKVDHAIIAMIARARAQTDPFAVWGDGSQVRNWTYVDDIVQGTVLAAERIHDGTAVNLGTTERTTVAEAVEYIIDYAGDLDGERYDPTIQLDITAPTGPVNRVADNGLAAKLLDWEPQVSIFDGIRRTMQWYWQNYTPDDAREQLLKVMER